MKRILTLCALTMALTVANAAPFVFVKVSSAAANKCVLAGALSGEYAVTDAAHEGQRGCKIDAAGAPVGENTLTAAAKSDLWGVLGAPVPFSFTRPSSSGLTVELIQLVP
jgi:hypothetical protein